MDKEQELKQFKSQIEVAKLLAENFDAENSEEFQKLIKTLATPPSYQDIKASELRDLQISRIIAEIKQKALESDNFEVKYVTTWANIKITEIIKEKLIMDGYKCDILHNGSVLKISW